MRYRVNMIIHRTYEIEADSIGEAEDKSFEAFKNDKDIIGSAYGELYCLDAIDENGDTLDEYYYY